MKQHINKIYYICHYCMDYRTDVKGDMKKHFSRKNKCKCMTTISYEMAKELTLNKVFEFTFDNSNLLMNDIIFIVNNFNEKHNIINKKFKKHNFMIEDLKNNKFENNDIHIIDNIIENNNSELICLEKEEKDDTIDMDEFDRVFFNKEKNKYVCDECFSEYTRKFNLVRHKNQVTNCGYRSSVNKMLNKNKDIIVTANKREEEENKKFQQHIIQNIQNIQNNQNIDTQNVNTLNNTYNFTIKDFVHDRYDLTHIKDSFYEKKDFFTYPNFLRIIMENEKNRNIFFTNNEAIIYSDNELNRISSDKAGYLVLDKLSQSFDQLMYQQDEETRKYYNFIAKYYHVIKGHYKHDTIFKDYDVEQHKFIYTANSGMFRSRDKYLSKIVSTTNKFSDEMKENIHDMGCQIKDIPLINPSIEDFASTKMRYRDLKNKD